MKENHIFNENLILLKSFLTFLFLIGAYLYRCSSLKNQAIFYFLKTTYTSLFLSFFSDNLLAKFYKSHFFKTFRSGASFSLLFDFLITSCPALLCFTITFCCDFNSASKFSIFFFSTHAFFWYCCSFSKDVLFLSFFFISLG